MKRRTIDDGLVELAEEVILQAVRDLRILERHGVISRDREIFPWKLSDGHRRSKSSGAYRHIDGIRWHSEVVELMGFFEGWPIDFMCHLTGHQACRIRRALRIKRKCES